MKHQRYEVNVVQSSFEIYQQKIKEIENSHGIHAKEKKKAAKPKKAKTAFDRIVSLSKTRDRCTKELEDRLRREDFSEKEISEAIQRSVSCGLVDDKRFADIYARSKSRALWGPYTIKRELKKRNLSVELLDGWPDEYELGDDSLREHALELLNRRPPTSKNAQASAYRRLLTKGYPQSIAFDVSKKWANMNR